MALEVRIYGLGSVCTLFAEPSWTVRRLKQAAEEASGVPARELRLLTGSREHRDLDRLGHLSSGGCSEQQLELSCVRRPPEQAKWLEAVGRDDCGDFLAEAPDHICADREVLLAAVAQNGRALQYASDELREDRDLVLVALEEDPDALDYASPALWSDCTFAEAAVTRCGAALRDVSEELRGERRVVMAAVRRDGLALRFAAEHLRADREVVLAAVEENGDALKYADMELQLDQELIDAAS